MNRTAIVTDSGMSLSQEEKYTLKIYDFSYVITECGLSFTTENTRKIIAEKDNIDFLPKERALSYSRPYFTDWANTIRSRFDNGQDILYISTSQKVSKEILIIKAYCDLITKDFPNRKLIYFDSKLLGRSGAYLVKKAANLAFDNVPPDEIISTLLTLKKNIKTIWVPDRESMYNIQFPSRYGALTYNENGEIIPDKSFSSQQEMNNYYENTFKDWNLVEISYRMPSYHRTGVIEQRNNLMNFQNKTFYEISPFIFHSLGINAVEYTFIKK